MDSVKTQETISRNPGYSVLIGGRAGFGIDTSGSLIGRILNQLGYRIYIYRDYPSLIRGGHTYSIIRVSENKVAAHYDTVDFLLALNQDTYNLHKTRLKNNTVVIYDSDTVKAEGVPVPIEKIIREEKASEIMRNSCIIGSFCKAAGIDWQILERTFRKNIPKEPELNLKVARRGFDHVGKSVQMECLTREFLPVVVGNDAISLGLIKAGLEAFISYPMTPTSGILHFMANFAEEFGITVVHPESEISVILMALGFAYTGKRAAVATSGGGFCLMTEGLSFAAMAELPIVIVVGQRPGPSTGLPTYTSQTDLHFVLNAGQGEFPRFVTAPGDAEEAYYWSALSLNLAWKYQIPAIILSDKTLSEGAYSFDINSAGEIKQEPFNLWDRAKPYQRYMNTETGVSPFAFVPDKDAVIKINSYEHDESGITTEDPGVTQIMQDKRLKKEYFLAKELEEYETVKIYGNKKSPTALLCWGSNKGVCVETAQTLGLKVILVQVMSPFPLKRFRQALRGVKNLICVENNRNGQLETLINRYGFKVNKRVSKYDGRPFTPDYLNNEIKKAVQ